MPSRIGQFFWAFLLGLITTVPSPSFAEFNPKTLPSHLKVQSVGNIPIVYREEGSGDTLVILTPYPFGTSLWTQLTKQLVSSFRLIIVEPPGLRDPASMEGDFSSQHLLMIYRQFVKDLKLYEIYIMGVGESGAMAVAFGHHFPEHTRAVISINGFESVNWTKSFEQTMIYFQQSTQGGVGNLLSMGTTKYRKAPPSEKQLDQWLTPLPAEEHKKAVQARFSAYAHDVRFGYILGMIPYVDRPLLIIRPASDMLLSEEFHQRTLQTVKKVKVRYMTIPDAGHFAFLDQPKKVAELIRKFTGK